jgi:hypothetical protein
MYWPVRQAQPLGVCLRIAFCCAEFA